MNNNSKTAKKLTGSIIAVIVLAICLCITTFALVWATVSVENNLFHTGLHQHLLSGMIRNYLLFFLIGFDVLYFTTGNRCCQSFFRKVSAGF